MGCSGSKDTPAPQEPVPAAAPSKGGNGDATATPVVPAPVEQSDVKLTLHTASGNGSSNQSMPVRPLLCTASFHV